MTELLLLALGASLVNHFAATALPGLRAAAGVQDRAPAAAAMAVAVLCVLPLACGIADLITRFVPAGNLHTLALFLVVVTVAPLVERTLQVTAPRWSARPRGFVPLLAMNCAVLGAGFVRIDQRATLVESLSYGLIAAAAFALVLVTFTLLDARVDTSDVPRAFRGAPIALVSAGLFALAVAGLGAR